MAEAKTTDKHISTRKRVTVTVSKDCMTSTVVMRQPRPEEPPISIEELVKEMESAEIVFGINEEAVNRCISEQVYNQPVVIASGKRPRRGESARFEYKFDTSQDHKPQVDEKGNVDYKNINFIQDAGEGDLLAVKIPPTPGEPGMTVHGKEIQGPPGRDLQFRGGANTKVSDDGLELVATAGGAIVYVNGIIAVNNVTVIEGDVDFRVGNIDTRGSIRVRGDVKAGFTLKADGDVEVNGIVEDSFLYVKGNIFIKGGVVGKGVGEIRADGDITFKFAQGQKFYAGSSVYVGDEIVNCQVVAKDSVSVRSRHGKIVGGEVKAGKQIRAAILGSEAGTATRLKVAYDSELMEQYDETLAEIKRLKKDEKRIKLGLEGLHRLRADGRLSPKQLLAMKKFEQFQKILPSAISSLEQKKTEIEKAIEKLQDTSIVADQTMYAGVQVHFGLSSRNIFEEQHRCRVSVSDNQIVISELTEM
jgi:uncharacterized protein (DUF342 family)